MPPTDQKVIGLNPIEVTESKTPKALSSKGFAA